ncbi:hypothetical protein HHK36_021402 [Tetracentron sinense]|uniref:CUE domain-containing protein n=1 Tax=Tetracentron sinense TaxID=13715 RepID=A0A834YU63_TETSI|nr:hypothetical protein HHK36_021402 [Tetracentron sinense]
MSAIVCGKRSFFEDLPTPSVSKRIRRSSSSPIRFSPPRPTAVQSPSPLAVPPPLLDHLRTIFPDMDKQALKQIFDYSHKSNVLASCFLHVKRCSPRMCIVITNGDVASSEEPSAPNNLPIDGSEWVELFVREMMSASNMDDARAHASRVLEVLEKSICMRAGAEAAKSSLKENLMLKEQVEALIRENTILKRAVAIQHERQKENDNRSQELQHLKQLASQYQEQLRTLEVNNYALTIHLRQAQQSNSFPGRFHPDVF